MKIFILSILLSLFLQITSLSNRNLYSECNDIVYQQDILNSEICSSDFAIISSTSTYSIDESIHITVRSNQSNRTFSGIHLYAQNDENENVGYWKTSNSLLKITACGSLMHSSIVEKSMVDAIWRAPSTNYGDINIKAIIIEDDNTIYFDCYNIILSPRVDYGTSINDPRDPMANATPEKATTIINTTTIVSNTTYTASPTADVSVNVTWTFNTIKNTTNITMTINNLKSSEWAAIGLGMDEAMGEAHVFMCKRLANDTIVLTRYINPGGHQHPEPAGSEQGGVLSILRQQLSDGTVLCQFELSNFFTQTNQQTRGIKPLSQSTEYHPIFAVGMLDSDDDPQRHAKDSRMPLSVLVQLDKNEVILYKVKTPSTGDTIKFVRVHGIIMVFTWITIASTGILFSRYFKNSWPNQTICGKATWFSAHRLLMSIVTILTVLGFMFILIFNQGEWVDKGPTRNYAHSITGAIVICFTFLQPFMALYRCEPSSQFRFIFNYFHAFIGISAFVLSIATLFLATYFKLFTDEQPRYAMIAWIGWIFLIFLLFEIVEKVLSRNGSNYSQLDRSVGESHDNIQTTTHFSDTKETKSLRTSKVILLATHILVAIIIASILTNKII